MAHVATAAFLLLCAYCMALVQHRSGYHSQALVRGRRKEPGTHCACANSLGNLGKLSMHSVYQALFSLPSHVLQHLAGMDEHVDNFYKQSAEWLRCSFIIVHTEHGQ